MQTFYCLLTYYTEAAKSEGDKILVYSAGDDDGRAGTSHSSIPSYLPFPLEYNIINFLFSFFSSLPFLIGMFVCAYLMRLNDWSLEKAFLHFKHASPSFSPNVAILARLGEYETALSGTKHLEESIKRQEGGEGKRREEVSEELKYVRRQQAYQLEEERAAQEEEEEDLC